MSSFGCRARFRGLTTYDNHAATSDLPEIADATLYTAQQGGRNQVWPALRIDAIYGYSPLQPCGYSYQEYSTRAARTALLCAQKE